MEDVLGSFTCNPTSAPAQRTAASEDDEVRIHRDVATVAREWIDLEASAASSIFQSHAWCSAWAEASRESGRPEEPCILTIRSSGRLVLLWPLAIRRFGPFKVLQSFADPATQYCDALVESGPDRGRWLELAWDSICSMRGIDAVRLVGVRSDAAIATLVASCRNAAVTRVDAAPFADFSGMAGPTRRRSGRTRNALQRHLRNLAEHGPTSFAMVDGASARVAAMREVRDLKLAWLHRTAQISAGWSHPANDLFLQKLATRSDFIVVRLAVGSSTAALEAGLLRNGRYWSLVQSYDGRFASHGPGRLLFWHMIENADALQIEVFDFLAPACKHKSEWANGHMTVRDYVVPLRAGGWLVAVYVSHMRTRMKRWATRVSQWLRPGRSVA